MSVVNVWSGAVTRTSARVIAKVSGSSARLLVADNEQLISPAFFGPVTPTAQDIASFEPSGLDPDTQYWYAVEVDSSLDTVFTGRFKTHPPLGEPARFKFLAGSCAAGRDHPAVGDVLVSNRISNHPVFRTMRLLHGDALFFAHNGDIHYYDIGSGVFVPNHDLATFRRAYDDVLLQPHQHDLYRHMPIQFMWDDHDYGPNNSDKNAPGRANHQQVFRERIPHYPLAEADAIYHSFQIGRVLFLSTDVRSDRDPNLDPDGPSKTMLGSAQKAWMENLLQSNSDGAELLCWQMTDQWMGTANDTWRNFPHEQAELTEMLGDTGWLDRMFIVSGDTHVLGIDSGATNRAGGLAGNGSGGGGFPVFQFASFDSGPVQNPTGQYDQGPTQWGTGQYGTIEIQDFGHFIEVTGTGWAGTNLWRTYSFQTPFIAPPKPIKPERVTQWFACDLVSGQIIAELPSITGSLSRIIGASTSTGLNIPIPLGGPDKPPPDIYSATDPGRTMIVAVLNDQPMWGGIVLRRQRGTEGTLTVSCASLESYLDHRFVRDHEWLEKDDTSLIAHGLAMDAEADEGIGLVIDARPSGRLRDRRYLDQDDKTVLSALQELSGIKDGPEFTIDLEWTDETRTAFAKVLRIRPRIGLESTQAVFDSKSKSEATYSFTEDYGDGRGANHIIATSSGEGEVRPQSIPARDEQQFHIGWPRWERRFSPSTSITEIETLNTHAHSDLELRHLGARTFDIEVRGDEYPRLGIDWNLGDNVRWHLFGHGHPHNIHRQPPGYADVVREQIPGIVLWYPLNEGPVVDVDGNRDPVDTVHNLGSVGSLGDGRASHEFIGGANPLITQGTAFEFDQAQSQHVTINAGSTAINGREALTVALWFNATNASQNDFLIDSTNSSVIGGLSIRKGVGDRLFCNLQLDNGGRTLVSTPLNSVTAGATHFVVMSWRSGRDIRVWIDGTPQSLTVNAGDLAPSGVTSSTSPDLLLGKWRASAVTTNFLHGRLDQVVVAETYLTSKQVDTVYTAGLTPFRRTFTAEGGLTGEGRVIGWEWTVPDNKVKPILYHPDELPPPDPGIEIEDDDAEDEEED